MDHDAVNAVFVPKLTRMETKADISARVAREIMDTEVARRNAKTARLRAARLEREAENAANGTTSAALPKWKKTLRKS
ncbi:hypothetical protein ACVCNR_17405 (plasmid) [Aquamicrobium terrae]